MTPPYRIARFSPTVALLPLLLIFNVVLRAQVLPLRRNSLPTQSSIPSKTAARAFNQNFSAMSSNQANAAQQLPKFIAHREYVAADGPQNLAAGDLNGDGIPDPVVPNGNSTNVSVLLGNRDGSFRPFVLFDAGGAGPFDVQIADFNGDGKNDVAVTTASGVSILFGDGKGNLGSPTVLLTGTVPTRIAIADFNGDHKLDIAVTNLGSNDVSILIGNGDGTFAPAVNLPVGMGPAGIAVGDFNGDGTPDLAIANSGTVFGNNRGPNANTVQILLGDGKGGFKSAAVIPVQKTPLVVLVSDFNKDGNQDLAVSSTAKGFVSELLGNGDGTFQSPRAFQVVPAANNMSVADFDGDGNADIAVTVSPFSQTLSNIVVLFGDGKGNFKPAVGTPAGRNPSAVVAGDFNHDGKPDYITANFDSNTVAVMLGRGNGTFLNLGPGIPDSSSVSGATITADFNNDGIQDLAVANTGSGPFGHSVAILLGRKDGTFEAAKSFEVGAVPDGLAAADINHDGHLDLVVADFGGTAGTPDMAVLLGNGDGTFQTARHFTAGPGFPFSVALADFNGDGNLDAVVAQGGFSGAVSVLLGDGQGRFGSPQDLAAGDREFQVVAADFNRDGKPDVAYLDIDANTLFVQLGNGDGTFQAPRGITSLALAGTSFAVADFNNDGIPDLAIEANGLVEMLLGDGTGRFRSLGTFSEGTASGFAFVPSLVVGDFNGDGFLDVAAPDGFGETVSFLPGKGDGTLGPATLFQGGFADSAATVNFPGLAPAIAIATDDGTVHLLRNLTTTSQ